MVSCWFWQFHSRFRCSREIRVDSRSTCQCVRRISVATSFSRYRPIGTSSDTPESSTCLEVLDTVCRRLWRDVQAPTAPPKEYEWKPLWNRPWAFQDLVTSIRPLSFLAMTNSLECFWWKIQSDNKIHGIQENDKVSWMFLVGLQDDCGKGLQKHGAEKRMKTALVEDEDHAE